ncbi:hypothetical protein B0H14DRAFT_1150588 [Mycena olivaceomarginata]|nr:hypothetical protein B0H14DRAFT_1150588 [Mycena olivaceomarginata]
MEDASGAVRSVVNDEPKDKTPDAILYCSTRRAHARGPRYHGYTGSSDSAQLQRTYPSSSPWMRERESPIRSQRSTRAWLRPRRAPPTPTSPAPLLLPRSATRLLGRAFRSPFLPPSHGTRPVPRPTVLQRRERDIATPSSVLRIRSSLRARRGAICGVMRWRDVLETRPRVRRDGLPREQADIARQGVVVAGARKGDRSCSMRRGRCLQVKVWCWRRLERRADLSPA